MNRRVLRLAVAMVSNERNESNPDPDGYCDAHSYCNSNTYSYSYSNSYSDTYTHRHGYTCSKADSDPTTAA